MKKLSILLMAAMFTFVSVLPSCSPIEADNGFDPDKKVPDPEGTVILSMRDKNSGNTYIDYRIGINNENFEGAEFIDLGAMHGLGNISYIPLGNWSPKVMVIPGHGYVAKSNDYGSVKYYRIYVMSYITGVSGGIIGAEVKYQAPFYGSNEAIQPDKKQILFGENGGSETVTFKNKYLIPYTVTSQDDWYTVQTNQNAIDITCKNLPDEERKGKIILSNMYGKTTEIQVSVKPLDILEMKSEIRDGYISAGRTPTAIVLEVSASNNYTFSSSDPSWCTVTLQGNGITKTMTIRVSETTQNRKAIISCDQKDFKFEVRQSKYVVGETYSEGGVTGTVFTFDKYMHGFIYKNVGSYVWSNENVTVGCNGSGVSNFEKIKAIPNWETLYPAFKAVNDLNTDGITGWYMPAIGEGPWLMSTTYWFSSECDSSKACKFKA